jgi:dimeric dUTPase (all-alpha-NTP-PPase superfamily)
MEDGCSPVHLVLNLPLTYLLIDILLQKRVWRINLAEEFETGHTGL